MNLSRSDTIAELIEYGRMARIKENRKMYYPAHSCYTIKKSGSSPNISPERYEYIDSIVSKLKNRDYEGQQALLFYYVDGMPYQVVAKKITKLTGLKCSYNKARELVENTVALVEGTLYPIY